MKSRSIDIQKKEERDQYPAISTEQAWSRQDLLYDLGEFFSCGIQRAISSGQDNTILTALGAITAQDLPHLATRGASHIIIKNTTFLKCDRKM